MISVLVSAGVLPTLSSYAKTKNINPYNEKRVLQQNRQIQKQNNAPDDFPNFIREGNKSMFFHFSLKIYWCDLAICFPCCNVSSYIRFSYMIMLLSVFNKKNATTFLPCDVYYKRHSCVILLQFRAKKFGA